MANPLKLVLAMVVLTIYMNHSQVAGRVYMVVNNKLGPNKVLDIHCKSKQTDLGQQHLAYGKSQTWDFKINFWGTTMFWCNMGWSNDQGKYVTANVHVYDARQNDRSDCGGVCIRDVKKDGVWFFNPEKPQNPAKLLNTWPNP